METIVGGVWKLVGAIPNFRDVIQSAAEANPEIPYKRGMLFRSALTSIASKEDVEYLVQELKLKTVIDLRSSAEYAKDPGARLLSQHFVHKGRPPMPKRLVTAHLVRVISAIGAALTAIGYAIGCLQFSLYCNKPVYISLFTAFALSGIITHMVYRWQHHLLPSDPNATISYWQSMSSVESTGNFEDIF